MTFTASQMSSWESCEMSRNGDSVELLRIPVSKAAKCAGYENFAKCFVGDALLIYIHSK